VKVDPNSKLWTCSGGATSDALKEFRFEALLYAHEEYLVDEYIECQLHLNMCGPQDCQFPDAKLHWWLGRQEQIEDEAAYFEEEYNIMFDKLRKVIESPLMYKDMSLKSKENYRRIIGETPDKV
jgi:hypothetical protein